MYFFAATVPQTFAGKLDAPTIEAADVKVTSEILSPKCENEETNMDTSDASKMPITTENAAFTTTEILPPTQGSNQGLNRPISQLQGLASNLSSASGIVINSNGITAKIIPQHGESLLYLNAARMATMNAGLPAALQGQPGNLEIPIDLTAVPKKLVKEWHYSTNQDLRNHLVRTM